LRRSRRSRHLLERVGKDSADRQRFPALALLQMQPAADVTHGGRDGGFIGRRIFPAVSAWLSMNMRAAGAAKASSRLIPLVDGLPIFLGDTET
jgi:hypothetical protein